MMTAVQSFYQRYVRAEDKIILGAIVCVMLLGFGFILENTFGARYTGNPIYPWTLLWFFPAILGLFLVALYARDLSPRWSLMAWMLSVFAFMYWGIRVLVSGTQLSPFYTIDPWLVRVDQSMGFDQLQWLAFTYQYHFLPRLLDKCYGFMNAEVMFLPWCLAGLGLARALRVFYMAILISFAIGALFYFFYPSTAPASMFSSPYFMEAQKNTFIKFYELHHGLPNTSLLGGMIAFPSFHVVWSVLCAYACKDKKYLWVPVVVLNTLIIVSTVMLGWHYLIDVIGGVVLAFLAILMAEWTHARYMGAPAR
jgi:hypothetical protein